MSDRVLALGRIPRPDRQEWLVIALVAVLALLFLPFVVWKTISLGQGDAQVFFRAGWAIWTGYPLYEVTDHHGWTYHYPPTFALFMGPFANPPPGHPQPVWALPYPAAVAVWYAVNAFCLIAAAHVWAGALERYRPFKVVLPVWLQGPWILRLGPVLALLPFVGDALVRGQPAPVLLLLIVAYFVLYVENRSSWAAFALALAATIKVFPVVLALFPLLRRDWKFLFLAAGWGALLLFGIPAICLGSGATIDLYHAMWSEHLAGIISGKMSTKIASEVSPGAYSSIGIGAVVARVAAGDAFYTPMPGWAAAVQNTFNVVVVVTVAALGRGGFWSLRDPQPDKGYPLLVAGAVLFAAIPLMITSAGPQYVTYAVPLIAAFMVEAWRHAADRVLIGRMFVWPVLAWIAMLLLEVPWSWVKIVGPMTWAMLLLAPESLLLVRRLSVEATEEATAGRWQRAHLS